MEVLNTQLMSIKEETTVQHHKTFVILWEIGFVHSHVVLLFYMPFISYSSLSKKNQNERDRSMTELKIIIYYFNVIKFKLCGMVCCLLVKITENKLYFHIIYLNKEAKNED